MPEKIIPETFTGMDGNLCGKELSRKGTGETYGRQ